MQRSRANVFLEVKYQLIHVYDSLGDYDKAWACLEEVEKRDPEYRSLRLLKRDLEPRIPLPKREKAS